MNERMKFRAIERHDYYLLEAKIEFKFNRAIPFRLPNSISIEKKILLQYGPLVNQIKVALSPNVV